MRVLMTGSEWFGSRPGGLNRYFEGLFMALQPLEGVVTEAYAFGDAPAGGASWGPMGGSTAARTLKSRSPRDRDQPHVLDRHFSLYGPPSPARRSAGLEVDHFHGPWAAESAVAGAGRLAQTVKYVVERSRYRKARALVVLSEPFKQLLVSRYGVDRERVEVIPPGVPEHFFHASPMNVEPKTVICVRRLERRMGIDVLLEAWRGVLQQHPEARLEIVGRGKEEGALRMMARSLGIADSVAFLGALDDSALAAAYARSRVSVVPSRALEGFGLVAAESLAASTPVIVTDVGGLPSTVADLDSSLVVPPEDSTALSERISAALDGALPERDRCRAHARRFSWAAVAARHLQLYSRLLESGA